MRLKAELMMIRMYKRYSPELLFTYGACLLNAHVRKYQEKVRKLSEKLNVLIRKNVNQPKYNFFIHRIINEMLLNQFV